MSFRVRFVCPHLTQLANQGALPACICAPTVCRSFSSNAAEAEPAVTRNSRRVGFTCIIERSYAFWVLAKNHDLVLRDFWNSQLKSRVPALPGASRLRGF